MFKAFYWMFTDAAVKEMFLKNIKFILITALIAIAIFFIASLFLTNFIVGGVLFILAIIALLLTTLLIVGYFWEMTASIIERETDIVSSSVYDGKTKSVEKITLPDINFKKCTWRGIASSVAILIMELPVILLLMSRVFLDNELLLPITIIVQFSIWFLSPGLFWNYAKKDSVFSILNVYTAGHLLEKRPGRYLWNCLLLILNFILLGLLTILLNYIFSASTPPDINNPLEMLKYSIYMLFAYIPWLYNIHVKAFLIGTLGDTNDF